MVFYFSVEFSIGETHRKQTIIPLVTMPASKSSCGLRRVHGIHAEFPFCAFQCEQVNSLRTENRRRQCP